MTESSVDRREFLGRAAIGGAAALSLSQTAAAAANGASRKVVVGVMGLSRGRALAMGLSKLADVEVKYCCDVDEQRAGKAAKEIGNTGAKEPETIQDFRRLLDDDSVDALVCAAPNHWHAPATILACSAGKHVYVEKPCSHNPWEGETMVAAARKHNRAVQLGTQRRSGPTMQEAMQRLHEGVIGRVYEARSWYTNLRGSIGAGKPADVPSHLDYELWQGPAPRLPYMSNRVHYNWHWFWHYGNGELGNNGVHTLDLCRWGLGVDYPIGVASTGGRWHFEDDQQTPDTHTVGYVFEGRRSITWQCHSCNKHGSRDAFVTFYGDNGSMDMDQNGTYRIFDKADKQQSESKSPNRGDNDHLQNFVAAVRDTSGTELSAEIEEGHKSTLLCHLGNIAHRVGRTLHCDPETGRILHDDGAMDLWKREYAEGWEPKI